MVEVLEERSIAEKEQVNYIGQQRAWFIDILAYKVHGSLPDDEVQDKNVKKDANWYVRKLEEHKGQWADLVLEVLWENRTTKKEYTGKSPFTLVYGADAVVPMEVQIPSLRIQLYEKQRNKKRMLEELDILPEVRLKATLELAAQISKAFNKMVKHKELLPGDLVLRRKAALGRGNQHGKLSAN
ncbi:uncharacterized protein LOC110709887 [Chenopodium quinoa]|uniref:uncharacterized protein LOC110709887 n=1 Tax=Chenopodium quinoa TaxID=63459 RepID=UPI000B780C2F|nr:uncharacterized protein LOC110709887 [Chenopodium quinoa]